MNCSHRMPFGAELTADGTRFRLWAPDARRVVLEMQFPEGESQQFDLVSKEDGWYELLVPGAGVGTRYSYRIDDEVDVPDPASRSNPDGVQGPSEVIEPAAFEWRDGEWRGRDWQEAVLYEMHVGTYTAEGTYASAATHLDELAELGVTAIELMPLATFPGRHGWGYDGVLLYAPHPTYGRPEDLKQFIQAAHERGLMVVLDVVYNHFGPEGNYLGRYAGEFFASEHRTPWGSAINFAQPPVREFFIHNALYWIEEYRFDGLRIDAVHAMHDDSPVHFIDELTDRVQRASGSERRVHVVLENHRNEVRRLGRKGNSFVAQWNDDSHHPLHVLLTGERDGYYADYADRPIQHLARVLAEGFAYQGERSVCSGMARGEPSAGLPPETFVDFLQNHDQIGNRAHGERLAQLAPPERLRAALAMLLLSPHIPMLFMGEEYAAPQPFLYFCDYEGELGEAVCAGRRNEFATFAAFADPQRRERIPDPNALSTFAASKLNHADKEQSEHRSWLTYTHDLLQVRAESVVPLVSQLVAGVSSYELRERALSVMWPARGGQVLTLHANLSDGAALPAMALEGEELFSTAATRENSAMLAAWEVRLLLRSA